MKKSFSCMVMSLCFLAGGFAQNMDFSDEAFFPTEENQQEPDADLDSLDSAPSVSDDEFGYSDEDFFGSSDDEFFEDDGIDELETLDEKSSALARGTLFEIGSVRVGGSITTSLSTFTPLYRDDNKNFGEHLLDTRLSPTADASLFVDARPTSTLRLYSKFGIKFPYKDSVSVAMSSSEPIDSETATSISDLLGGFDISTLSSLSFPSFSITNWLYLKELFTDFSIADRVFFRFGLHTVSWGAGFFFSPVSDMINTSSIDPEHTDVQVDGSLNLRTQITFPNTQNCLWLYVVPSTKAVFPSVQTEEERENLTLNEYMDDAMFPYLLKETAVAGKMDVVISNWELGFGGIFKYSSAPKLMATASGSIINGKIGVFAETVLSYGSQAQWNESSEWKSKDLIFQGTVGAMHVWTNPQIALMLQYYFDGNKDDHEYTTYGHNLAATVNYSNIAGSDFGANLFCLFYLGKTNVSTLSDAITKLTAGDAFMPYSGIISFSFSWTPLSALTVSAGPYITWLDMAKSPDVSFRLSVTLGGGKF